VNYNTRELLAECLNSISPGRDDCAVEVIVIDNASSDGSVELLCRRFPDVITILNDENNGFSRACNQGIRISRGRTVLLLNSDTELLPDTLMHLDIVKSGIPDPDRVGIIGCRILNPDGSLQYSFGRFPTLLSTVLDQFKPVAKRKYLLTGYDSRREVDWVTGAFLLIRREVIEEIGLLDERFFMYYEEVDWCRRAKQHGWKVLYDPAPAIIHKTPLASKKSTISDRLAYEVRRSHLYYFWKNRPFAEFIVLSLVTLLFLGLKWIRARTVLLSAEKEKGTSGNAGTLLADVWRDILQLMLSKRP
jgi:hypothetical protein